MSSRAPDAPSRTELKAASERLQDLGEELLTLRADLFEALPLPEELKDAILDARRITAFGARRRQLQFIGRLMHRLTAEELSAVDAALAIQHHRSADEARRLHLAEKWREALVAGDAACGAWLVAFPDTDAQQLRALIRQARKDARAMASGGRHGHAYRELFVLVRAALAAGGTGVPAPPAEEGSGHQPD